MRPASLKPAKHMSILHVSVPTALNAHPHLLPKALCKLRGHLAGAVRCSSRRTAANSIGPSSKHAVRPWHPARWELPVDVKRTAASVAAAVATAAAAVAADVAATAALLLTLSSLTGSSR